MEELGAKYLPSKRNHNYLCFYHQHFAPLRNSAHRVLEIGAETPRSLSMWEEYFPSAEIYGIDIDEACRRVESGRHKIFIGDQQDAAFCGTSSSKPAAVSTSSSTTACTPRAPSGPRSATSTKPRCIGSPAISSASHCTATSASLNAERILRLTPTLMTDAEFEARKATLREEVDRMIDTIIAEGGTPNAALVSERLGNRGLTTVRERLAARGL